LLLPHRLLVLSPHLDDAVFACGELIASSPGSAVATLFAGRPERCGPTAWDRDAGFADGDDVLGARRAEDQAALRVLGAMPLWLEFADGQYGEPAPMHALAAALCGIIESEDADAVLFPAGLFHGDHRRTHDAALFVLDRFPDRQWLVYEDALYRRIDGLLDERLRLLDAIGLAPQRFRPPIEADARSRKRRAVGCYRSQLMALAIRRGHRDAFAPEGYWRIGARRTR
jgi:LmbE family N-acetylglucosaminyl deacetylase